MKSDSPYTDLHLDDTDVHDDSAAEVSSLPLMGHEEKPWKSDIESHRRSRPRALCAALRPYKWLLDTTLLLVILGLLVERQWQAPAASPPPASNSTRFEIGSDISGFAPKFSQQITTFKPEPAFVPDNASDFFHPDVKRKWLEIVPRGLGYLEVEDPEQFDNLPTPLTEYSHKNRTVFTTSMTHQLHCLYAIIDAYSKLAINSPQLPEEMPWHLAHCFDYLRQSIMCCGDVALEGAQTTFPKGFDGSDGWDAKHVCRDYGQVYRHLEKNRADDDLWI